MNYCPLHMVSYERVCHQCIEELRRDGIEVVSVSTSGGGKTVCVVEERNEPVD